jgi:SAM-dependent methyltransferase
MKKEMRLTSREFWMNYWSNSSIQEVDNTPFFKEFISLFPKSPARFIEIGGFPGTYSVYFKKYHQYDVTLLDFVIDKKAIAQIEEVNHLDVGTIKCTEGDLFDLAAPENKYDVVFSAGFIEHFKDSKPVFKKHLEYLKDDGTLFVSVPNFKGIAGLVQRYFDPKNYAAHSLECMEIDFFKDLAKEENLEILFLNYAGTPHVWLDSPELLSSFSRMLVLLTSIFLQNLGRWFHFQNRFLSPYIILIAKKTKKLG